jgi:hypothetical protein
MAIKFTPVTLDDPRNRVIKVTGTQSKGKAKAAAAKRIQKNADISATKSGERPKVTLPKFSWDLDK